MAHSSSSSPPTGASTQGAASAADDVLDAVALQALRSLDPTGSSKLLERVLAAFETSTSRLVPQLRAARDSADVENLKQVAHTLKSSSASIGAVKLSRLCAEIDVMIRNGLPFTALEPSIAALDAEIATVLEALRNLLRNSP